VSQERAQDEVNDSDQERNSSVVNNLFSKFENNVRERQPQGFDSDVTSIKSLYLDIETREKDN
jgi:hypothetical protein